jgi:hypothetical protein
MASSFDFTILDLLKRAWDGTISGMKRARYSKRASSLWGVWPTERTALEAEPERICPYCESAISRTAKVCRFCAREVPALPIASVPRSTVIAILVVLAIVGWIAWHFVLGPIFSIIWGISTWKDPNAPAAVSDRLLVKSNAPCAGTIDAEVYIEHDVLTGSGSDAAQDILDRIASSDGVLLVPGEHLLVVGTDDGNASHVRITSDLESGKECWIDSDLLSKIATKQN